MRIKSPIYQGSQSWPFKHSLMLGYRAEWLSGDIVVDGIEIVDAQWFNITLTQTSTVRVNFAGNDRRLYQRAS